MYATVHAAPGAQNWKFWHDLQSVSVGTSADKYSAGRLVQRIDPGPYRSGQLARLGVRSWLIGVAGHRRISNYSSQSGWVSRSYGPGAGGAGTVP